MTRDEAWVHFASAALQSLVDDDADPSDGAETVVAAQFADSLLEAYDARFPPPPT